MATNPFARDPAVTVGVGADTSGFGDSIDGAIGKLGNFKGAVAGLGAALGAVAVGGLAKATTAAADFEESMVEVEKTTSPETAREMGEAVQDMAAEMPVAQDQLAGIAAQAGRFGVEGSENIEQFTETVAKMSVATDLSTEQAGESFAKLSTQMNEPIENVGDMGNVINELSNTMATSSSEITDSALRSSNTLSQMGASSEDILSLNAAMNEASESAERAGTRLRRMAQEIQNPKKVEDLASALGMTTDEFETMRSEDPTALFKRMAQTMGEGDDQAKALRSTLSSTSQQALTGLSQNMEGLAQAQETANQQMQEGTSLQSEYESASSTFNSKLQVTKNRLRNVGIQTGEVLLPHLSTLLGRINSGISAFSKLNKETDGMAGTAALAATAVGGLGTALAVFASGPVVTAATMLGGSLMASLVSVSGALTGLAGTVAGSLGILSTFSAALSGLSAAAIPMISTVGLLTASVSSFLAPVTGAIATVGAFGTSLMAVLGPIGLVVAAIGGIGYIIKENQTVIRKFADKAIGYLQRAVRKAATWIQNNGPRLLKQAFKAIGEGIRFVAKDIYNAVTGNGNSILKNIVTDIGSWLINNGPGILKGAAKLAFKGIMAAAKGLYEGLIGNSLFPEMFTDIASYIRNDAASDLASAAKNAADSLLTKFENALDLKGVVSDAISAAQKKISSWTPDWPDLSPPSVGGGGSDDGDGVVDRGKDMVGLDTGGYIKEGGIARLHAGERVIPEKDVERGGVGGTTVKVGKIVASGHREGQEAIRGLNDELDSHGV